MFISLNSALLSIVPLGILACTGCGELFPSTCPAPVIGREEIEIAGFGTLTRLTTSQSYDLASGRLNTQGQVAMTTFVSLGTLANCYAGVLVGDDVEVLAGGSVTDLSDTGLTVGNFAPSSVSKLQAAAWQDGSRTILPGTAGKLTLALAVNNAGDTIVGIVRDNAGFELARWHQAGGTWEMTLPGVAFANPVDVNNHGQIVGWIEEKVSSSPAETRRLPFLWEDGNLAMLPALPGSDFTHYIAPISRISDSGQIVGTLRLANADAESPSFRATLWEGSKVTDLGTLGGQSSGANGINSSGHIVGWSETRDGARHACIWENNGTPRDLNDVLTALGITLDEAYAINDNGAILATTADTHDLVVLIPSRTGH